MVVAGEVFLHDPSPGFRIVSVGFVLCDEGECREKGWENEREQLFHRWLWDIPREVVSLSASSKPVKKANDGEEDVENGWGVDFIDFEFGGVEVVIHVVHGGGGGELDFEPLFESKFFAGG